MLLTRREAFAAGLLPLSLAVRVTAVETPAARLATLDKSTGGRLGVAVIDATGRVLVAHRERERFPMCSTFKLLAAAAVLHRVDEGREHLDRRISYGPADLLEYAPITREHVAEGSMTVADLCKAAITVSDNTAANLLLATIGGPHGLTAYLRSVGDDTTRLDRNEPTLNEAIDGDPRDTTMPLAMAMTMRQLLTGRGLSDRSRQQLIAWLEATSTGDARLRAGLGSGWRIGDKTGTGAHGTSNDVAIVFRQARPAVLITAYLTGSPLADAARDGVIADVGRIARDLIA